MTNKSIKAPVKLLGFTTFFFFVAEALIMVLLDWLPGSSRHSHLQMIFLDATLLTMAGFPTLYFCLFRPLSAQIAKRRETEALLRAANERQEERIRERTNDLLSINRNLAREIEERQQAELALNRLGAAISQVAEGIFITDRDGVIGYVNASLEMITGYKSEEIIGRTPSMFKSGKQDRNFYQQLWKTILNGEIWSGHLVNRRKDGSMIEVEVTISPVFDQNQEISNFVAVKRDVTEQLQTEKRLLQAQKMEAIGTLAGGIAHDFNNILSSILGYAELALEDAAPNSASRHDLVQVLTAATRARELVKQILTFSRQTEVKRQPLLPQPIIKEALKLLRASLPATIEISQEISPRCGAIVADPTQLHQVFMNLCTNAFHAMEGNGGELRVTLECVGIPNDNQTCPPGVEPGLFAQLTIRDNGSGIDPVIREKIFDPYFTTKKSGRGTGLGLSIVHSIVTRHGGFITVESELGKGSAFRVYFPLAIHLSSGSDPEDAAIVGGSERILFVDDEELLCEMAQDMIARLGYEVTTRQSSGEALEKFKQDPEYFDLVITDMTMPAMTGDVLARKILEIRPEIPIVLLTGYSSMISEEKAKALGIREYCLKPLLRADIARLIRKALDERIGR